MNGIAIIGAGRLGTCLGSALLKKGYRIRALSCRRISSARESRRIIGAGKAFTDPIQAAREGEIIFICVPDEQIARVGNELASSRLDWSRRVVFHCSGLLPAETLRPLKQKGASVGSFHPVQSFAKKGCSLRHFEGVYFGLEGDVKALGRAQKIVSDLGGIPLRIRAGDKALHHAACSMASNFFVVLLDSAVSLLSSIGLTGEEASAILLPLVQGTLQNVKEFSIQASLTGPIIRGDSESVKKHLGALKKFPDQYQVYLSLAEQALKLAEKKNIPRRKVRALRQLLGGK